MAAWWGDFADLTDASYEPRMVLIQREELPMLHLSEVSGRVNLNRALAAGEGKVVRSFDQTNQVDGLSIY